MFQRLPRLVNFVCRPHYRATIGFGVSETTPLSMYVDIVHYRAMIGFGVSETTPSSCELCM